VTDFTHRVRERGSISNDDPSVKERLLTVKDVLEGEKIRWLVGKEKELTEAGNIFSDVVSVEEFDALMERNLRNEFNRCKILRLLNDVPLTVREISKRSHLGPEEVSSYLVDIEGEGRIAIHSIEGRNPKYIKVGR
jgi:DNA-binding transcriptional ArsR family regulator